MILRTKNQRENDKAYLATAMPVVIIGEITNPAETGGIARRSTGLVASRQITRHFFRKPDNHAVANTRLLCRPGIVIEFGLGQLQHSTVHRCKTLFLVSCLAATSAFA